MTAIGNPLHRNPDIDNLRTAHRVRLRRVRKAKIRPRSMHIGHVAEPAKQIWLGSNNLHDYRDVLLNAIMVVRLNQDLRYGEIQKLTIGTVTVVPGIECEGSLYFS